MVNAAQRTRVKVEADSRPSVDTHPPGTVLFTKQRRASPDDGLITQSIRAAATAGVLLCFVEKLIGLAGSI
ncbi:TPA: hypothetical protein ACU18Q_003553 [Escherichia coli]|uniref:hypothetical protein n=1 Tax=Escherichia coli TaxID=562 RepID=UPI001AEC7E8E|nr:hypothetical protein [Escherichia coli]MBP2794615.1 hypothetical protein [Escherichia coli]